MDDVVDQADQKEVQEGVSMKPSWHVCLILGLRIFDLQKSTIHGGTDVQ